MDFLPPAATNETFALLTIIADPEKHKAALDALAEKSAVGQKLFDEARASLKQAADDRSAAKQARDEAQRVSARHAQTAATLEAQAKQLSDHAAVLAKRQIDIETYEKQVNAAADKKHADLTAREANLVKRETEQAERIVKTRVDAASVAEAKADLEKRLDILRAIAGVAQAPAAHVLNAETGKLGADFHGKL